MKLTNIKRETFQPNEWKRRGKFSNYSNALTADVLWYIPTSNERRVTPKSREAYLCRYCTYIQTCEKSRLRLARVSAEDETESNEYFS